MSYVLPFEKPIVELERKLTELKSFSENQDLDVSSEVQKMERKIAEMKEKIYRKLSVHSRGEAVFEATQLGLLR